MEWTSYSIQLQPVSPQTCLDLAGPIHSLAWTLLLGPVIHALSKPTPPATSAHTNVAQTTHASRRMLHRCISHSTPPQQPCGCTRRTPAWPPSASLAPLCWAPPAPPCVAPSLACPPAQAGTGPRRCQCPVGRHPGQTLGRAGHHDLRAQQQGVL